MARPRTITDERLLEAARELFLEQGFSATTSAIARRAEVSEGTLFKRFSTKEELFAAAMGLREYARWREDLRTRVGEGEVRRNLERAVLAQIEEARRITPRLMAVLARGHDPEHNPLLTEITQSLGQDLDALSQYLQAEIALGRLRPHDTRLAATTLLGAVGHYLQGQHLQPAPPGQEVEVGRFVRGLLDLLWPGLEP